MCFVTSHTFLTHQLQIQSSR